MLEDHDKIKASKAVERFLSHCRLAQHSQFSHLFSCKEQAWINHILYDLTPNSVHLLLRLERRQRTAYFRISQLVTRYSRDFIDPSAIHEAIKELLYFRLIVLFNESFYTTQYKPLHINNTHELTDTDIVDPLWIFLTLSISEVNDVITSLKGDIKDLWKKLRTKRGVFSKQLWIKELHQLVTATRTLSGKDLKVFMISKLLEKYTEMITLPLATRTMFRKLNVLESAFNLDPEVFSVAGSFMLTSDTLLSQCRQILHLERLSPLFFLERSTAPSFFISNIVGEQQLEKSTKCELIFTTLQHYETFERARFVHKVVALTYSQKGYKDVCSLSCAMETILNRFLFKKACAFKTLESPDIFFSNPCFASPQEAQHFLLRSQHTLHARFTLEWITALTLYDVIKAYELLGSHHTTVVRLIELVLDTHLITGLRVKLFNRLMIHSFCYLKQPMVALETAVNAFRESFVKPFSHPLFFEIAERLKRVLKACFILTKQSNQQFKVTMKKVSDEFWFNYLPKGLRSDVLELLQLRQSYEMKIVRRNILGDSIAPLRQGRSSHLITRRSFLNEAEQLVSVEEYALEWYQLHNVLNQSTCTLTGLHDEGGLLLELYGILLHDILFDSRVPNAFLFPAQNAPLDLFCDKFYSARQLFIERRLENLSSLNKTQFFLEILICALRLHPKEIINVSWRALDRVKMSVSGSNWWENYTNYLYGSLFWKNLLEHCPVLYSLPHFSSCLTLRSSSTFSSKPAFHHTQIFEQCLFLAVLGTGIGCKVLNTVFKGLCLNYMNMRSGFPDLLMWQTQEIQHDKDVTEFPSVIVMFAEIKSPNDRVSEKQRRWLALLNDAGARVELCCIQQATFKKKRQKTS